MKDLALRALDAASRGAASPTPMCAPSKSATAKSPPRTARPATSPAPNPQGVGIRVLAYGCWGFAATDDLTQPRASSRRRTGPRNRPRRHRRQEARRRAGAGTRSTRPPGFRPAASIPFPFRWTATWPRCWPWIAELRRKPAISLAEAAMHFERQPPGLRLHARQPHRSDPLPSAARAFRRSATRMAKSRSAPTPTPSAASIS